jgi:hypothetical protein
MRINFGPEANIELLSVETPLCQIVLLLLSVIAHTSYPWCGLGTLHVSWVESVTWTVLHWCEVIAV